MKVTLNKGKNGAEFGNLRHSRARENIHGVLSWDFFTGCDVGDFDGAGRGGFHSRGLRAFAYLCHIPAAALKSSLWDLCDCDQVSFLSVCSSDDVLSSSFNFPLSPSCSAKNWVTVRSVEQQQTSTSS